MFNVVTQLENDAVEMRKVYAGAVRRQIEAGAPIIALGFDDPRMRHILPRYPKEREKIVVNAMPPRGVLIALSQIRMIALW